jgi:acetyl-CoA carboxylase biotin carboxyl carrier protein
LDLKDIKAIIDLMKKNDLAVFKLEKEGFKLELEAHQDQPPVVSVPYPTPLAPAPVSPSINPVPAPVQSAVLAPDHKEITSPMVGTFYRAPSPDSAPYAAVGQEATADTVVCIIEAMKVMNEIKAEMSGTITEVLVENGTPVQFGQPLFRIK